MSCLSLRNSLVGQPPRKKSGLVLKVILDMVCILLVAAGIFAIKFGSKPYHRGFFCDDESIKHPVLADTVSVTLCACVGIIVPLVVIIVLEFLLRANVRVYSLSISWPGAQKHSWLYQTYNAVIVFVFGMAVTQFLTEIGKYSVGRLRPHFLTLCAPDWSRVNCSAGFVTEDVCTSKDDAMLTEARLSFPSGHSSFSMYCMLYIILYLQTKVCCSALILLKPVAQLVFFTLGFYTCLSRISDYKHHWSDVLSGAVLGMSVCVCVVISLADFGQVLTFRAGTGGKTSSPSLPRTLDDSPPTMARRSFQDNSVLGEITTSQPGKLSLQLDV